MTGPQGEKVHRVRVSRSESDPLVQLADYIAGVTNRLYGEKPRSGEYYAFLRNQRRSQRRCPPPIRKKRNAHLEGDSSASGPVSLAIMARLPTWHSSLPRRKS